MTREEAIKTLRELWRETNDPWYEEVYNMAIEALQREEAEEKGWCHRIRPKNVEVVVRCKDCKYWQESKNYSYCKVINVKGRSPKRIDFCSYGERREP